MTEKDRVRPYIIVNRRKFEEGDGVKHIMTGAEIAALIGVQPDNAVIRQETSDEPHPLAVTDKVEIKGGESFLVTRKTVEGGHEPGAY